MMTQVKTLVMRSLLLDAMTMKRTRRKRSLPPRSGRYALSPVLPEWALIRPLADCPRLEGQACVQS